jgi:hypothetical protein
MKKILLLLVLVANGLFTPSFIAAQNVGIGTNVPQSKLNINGTAWFQGDNTPLPPAAGSGIGLGFTPGATGGYIFGFNYSTFTPRNLWLQSPGGSVLVGSTAAALARLDVTGNGMRAIRAITNSEEAFNGFSSGGHAIIGISSSNLGVYAVSQAAGGAGLLAEGNYIGLQGNNKGSDANRQAVRGENNSNAAGGFAGIFVGGTTWVVGTLQKNAGAFVIDHPLDPENKYLYHSFVESPDMKNIYDGVVTTGPDGIAIVLMPDWFEALNMDFRYQLTCIGQFAQAIILDEMSNHQFTIKTDKPGVKVSWQVTGIRNDPYARDNRIPLEKIKSGSEMGKYIYPAGYGKDNSFLLDVLKPSNTGTVALPKANGQ